MSEFHSTEVKRSEYRIIFKSTEDGGMEVLVEVVGEDNTTVTQIGDYFYRNIRNIMNIMEEE